MSIYIDILGQFIKTQPRNKYLFVIADRSSKMTRTK